MLNVDMLSAFVICGAGALIGAAWLYHAEAPNALAVAGLRTSAQAMLVLGLGLVQLLFAGSVPGPWAQWVVVECTLIALVLLGWGLARVAEEPPAPMAMAAALVLAALLPIAGRTVGPSGVAQSLAWGMMLAAGLTLYVARRFVTRPANGAARVVGVCMLVFAILSVLRVGWTMNYKGVVPAHMVMVPPAMLTCYAVLYGVLPILMAMLLLGQVNAQLREQLNERVATDELTGALTRRAAREQADRHIAQARRSNLEVAVMMFDLDSFKRINDLHGHHIGDDVLREAAAALRSHLRPDALFARYGGEEFVAVLPVQDLPTARRVAERLRESVVQTAFSGSDGAPLRVTVSVGVTLFSHGENLDDALMRADEALYRAKRDGRNQVQFSLKAA